MPQRPDQIPKAEEIGTVTSNRLHGLTTARKGAVMPLLQSRDKSGHRFKIITYVLKISGMQTAAP